MNSIICEERMIIDVKRNVFTHMEGLSFAWKEFCFESLHEWFKLTTSIQELAIHDIGTRVKGVSGLLAEVRVC